jgi:hypothetical protein
MSHAWKCPECLWMNSAATVKCGRCETTIPEGRDL